jgi:hypothetical protein
VTQKNAAIIGESTAVAHVLADEVEILAKLIARFRICRAAEDLSDRELKNGRRTFLPRADAGSRGRVLGARVLNRRSGERPRLWPVGPLRIEWRRRRPARVLNGDGGNPDKIVAAVRRGYQVLDLILEDPVPIRSLSPSPSADSRF